MKEALFKDNKYFLYLQVARNGDFDYTVYDRDFNVVDRGRVCWDGMADMRDIAENMLDEFVKQVCVEDYEDLL